MVDVWNEVHWMIHIQFVDCFCQVVEYSEISKETAELMEGGRWAHFQNMEKLGKFGKLREWEAGLEKLGLVIWITFIVTTSDKTFPYFDSLGSHILYKYLQAGIQSRKYLQPLLYKRFLKSKNHSEAKNAKNFMCHFFSLTKRKHFPASLRRARKAASAPYCKKEDSFHWPRRWQCCQVWSALKEN